VRDGIVAWADTGFSHLVVQVDELAATAGTVVTR
jgi:hypothetical protein